MQRLKLFIPLIVFALVAGLLLTSLGRDTQFIPSTLIDKPMPEFSLGVLSDQGNRYGKEAIIEDVSLLNVWASWCFACRIEHPVLTRVAAEHQVPLYGLNYKDEPADALRWLQQFGNPYVKSFMDIDGTLGIDLGVYGAPETFVLDRNRVIRYKHVGVIDDKVWRDTLLPIVEELRAES